MIPEALCFISPKSFYQNELDTKISPCLCPFHEDKRPSFSWRADTGQAICLAATCGVKIPHIVGFYSRRYGVTDAEAALKMWEYYIHPLEPLDRVNLLHNELKQKPDVLRLLCRERGLAVSTVETEKIGFDIANNRIALPVWLDGRKHCAGFRYWLPSAWRKARDEAKIFHDVGVPDLLFGGWRILADIRGRTIYYMGSELCSILAGQDGFLAVSGMHGEGKFNPAWKMYFEGRNVVVCIGADHPKEAEAVTGFIRSCGGYASMVTWPDGGDSKAKDYTDFRNAGIIGKEWLEGFRTEETIVVDKEPVQSVERTIVPFSQATKSENSNIPLRIKAVVSGVESEHYLIPRKIICEMANGTSQVCNLDDSRDVLYLMGAGEGSYEKLARKKIALGTSKIAGMTPLDFIEVYRCQLARDLSEDDRDVDFTQHLGIAIGFHPTVNTRYEIDCMSVSDPHSHAATILMEKIRDLGTTHHKLSHENFEYLRTLTEPIRTCFSASQLEVKLKRVVDDLAFKNTGIMGRPELHMAVMLSYLCPRSFRMEGGEQRGWLQALVLGDSRTGKSEVASNIGRLLGVGETVSSENCTFAGMVGGMQKISGERLMLVWGRLPRNHGGHLTIEEASSLSIEDWSRLTDVRSSGIARLDKVGTSHQTRAATRQLYLANPRGGMSINRSVNAVKLVQYLVGANEDIARFDLIAILATEEIDKEAMNAFLRTRGQKHDPLIHEIAWPLLVQWVWSLEDNDCYLTPKAEELARQLSVKLGNEFHHEVPIFKSEDGRYKLARIAAAFAAWQLSLDESNKLKVKSMHVQMAHDFLRALWTKECFGYDRWSRAFLQGQTLDDKKLLGIIKEVTGSGVPFVSFCDMMADKEIFTIDDLSECAATDRQGATLLLQKLNHEKVARRVPDTKGSYKSKWTLTPAFRKLLTKWSNQNDTK